MTAALSFLFTTRLGNLLLTALAVVALVGFATLAIQRWERTIRADERQAALTEFNQRQLQQYAKDQAAAEAERVRQQASLETIQRELDQQNARAGERAGEAERAIEDATLQDRPLSPLLRKMLEELAGLSRLEPQR